VVSTPLQWVAWKSDLSLANKKTRLGGFNEMVSLTEKPCRFTLAGLFSFSAEDLS
jgi:hypothetical protein